MGKSRKDRARHKQDRAFDAFGLEDRDISAERNKARDLRASEWWKRRKAKGVCEYCGQSVPPAELTMDHVVPVSAGGRTTRGNVACVCKKCNTAKHSKVLPALDEATD